VVINNICQIRDGLFSSLPVLFGNGSESLNQEGWFLLYMKIGLIPG